MLTAKESDIAISTLFDAQKKFVHPSAYSRCEGESDQIFSRTISKISSRDLVAICFTLWFRMTAIARSSNNSNNILAVKIGRYPPKCSHGGGGKNWCFEMRNASFKCCLMLCDPNNLEEKQWDKSQEMNRKFCMKSGAKTVTLLTATFVVLSKLHIASFCSRNAIKVKTNFA